MKNEVRDEERALGSSSITNVMTSQSSRKVQARSRYVIRTSEVLRAVNIRGGSHRLISKKIFENKNVEMGLVRFRPRALASKSPSKTIMHRDKQVICSVLEGSGVVQIGKDKHKLVPGMIVTISAGTRHSFYTSNDNPGLILFYALAKVRG